MPKLEQWSVIGPEVPSVYDPPEMRSRYLTGRVYNHPSIEDGRAIQTSKIRSSEGRFVTTVTGTLYELGAPSEDWLDWLENNGLRLDSVEPVKVLDV